jgi:hypothetical protein
MTTTRSSFWRRRETSFVYLPHAPFYRMLTIWNARLSEHLARDPFFVKTFGTTPR